MLGKRIQQKPAEQSWATRPGEVIQGGYGRAVYTDGSTEHFLFGGLGGEYKGVALSASLYVSRVAGDPWYQFQIGSNVDASVGRLAGGAGAGWNIDSLTSCIDHRFH